MGLTNLINKITNPKPKQKKDIDFKTEKKMDELISLCFSITKEGQLFIDGKWINNSIEVANAMASFIHLMFSGNLYPNIINYFNTISTINEEYFEFSKNTLSFIEELLESEDENDESPIIRPSQAFKFGEKQDSPVINNNDIEDDDDIEINS